MSEQEYSINICALFLQSVGSLTHVGHGLNNFIVFQYVEKLITTIQVEGEIYWAVDTIAFQFYWTIIRTMSGDINDIKSMMDV